MRDPWQRWPEGSPDLSICEINLHQSALYQSEPSGACCLSVLRDIMLLPSAEQYIKFLNLHGPCKHCLTLLPGADFSV